MKENKNYQIIVKTMAGLEDVLAKEIESIGGEGIEIKTRAVQFKGDKEMIYKSNYLLRTALRVLIPIKEFKVKDEMDLYKGVGEIVWKKYLDIDGTFAVDSVMTNDPPFNHSKFIALRTKDAIVDQFRRIYNKRPSVDAQNPDLRLHVHVNGQTCNVLLDSSGSSLHQRGYRIEADKAPINEVLAAGLIQLSGWDANSNFVDPMCGSGTIPMEAAMYAMNIPAGYYRKEFNFEYWNDFDSDLWQKVREEADAEWRDFDFEIIGSDRSIKAINIAKANVKHAKLHKDIQIRRCFMDESEVPEGDGIIIMNPPYGERLEEEDLIALYQEIGDALKQKFQGYSAFVISSDFTALKHVGLKSTRRIPVYNGPLECKVFQFDLYEGSKKGKYIEAKEKEAQELSVEDKTDE